MNNMLDSSSSNDDYEIPRHKKRKSGKLNEKYENAPVRKEDLWPKTLKEAYTRLINYKFIPNITLKVISTLKELCILITKSMK